VARLRVRWTKDPDDRPAIGEALARLESIPGSDTTEFCPGSGAQAADLRLDATTGEVAQSGPPKPTDLYVRRVRLRTTIEAADGRRLEAHFGSEFDVPQTDIDAPNDLRDAMIRAWRARSLSGRPSEQADRVAAIITAVREIGPDATRLEVGQVLRRLDDMEARERMRRRVGRR
jgi:hypothetical protein